MNLKAVSASEAVLFYLMRGGRQRGQKEKRREKTGGGKGAKGKTTGKKWAGERVQKVKRMENKPDGGKGA